MSSIPTKTQAIYNFFSSFGMEAFEENSVYSLEGAPDYPYITYELKTDFFSDTDTVISASVWTRSTSWATANAYAEQISAAVGRSGLITQIEGGYMLIMRRSPFAQSMGDPGDDMVKRKLLSFALRFYTND